MKKRIGQTGRKMAAVLMAASLLAGCGGSGETASEGTDGNAAMESTPAVAEAETGKETAAAEGGEAYAVPFGNGESDELTVACLEGWYQYPSMIIWRSGRRLRTGRG